MNRNKKLLAALALNSLAVAANSVQPGINQVKYGQLYGKIIKNIETGKSNKKNYELIEQVLNQRNKELRDLYLQGDYVVKPEYLEWQVFFSGFYTEDNKGDNTSENAKYHSNPSYNNAGYYNSQGEFVVTNYGTSGTRGKEYQAPQASKDVDLGVNIPVNSIVRAPISNFSFSSVPEVNVNPKSLNIIVPASLNVPQINPLEFQPISPVVKIFNMPDVPTFTLGITGAGNGDGAYFVQNGNSNAVISQWDMDSGIFNIYSTGYNNYTYTFSGVTNQAPSLNGSIGGPRYTSTGILTASGGSTSNVMEQGFYRVVGAPMVRLGSGVVFNMEGDHNPSSIEGLQHIFHYDAHADRALDLDTLEMNGIISSAEKADFTKYVDNTNSELFQYVKFEGAVNLTGSDVLAVNLQDHWGKKGVTSVFKNEGTIIGHDNLTTSNYESRRQVAFAWTEDQTDTRKLIFDNSGTVELRAADSVGFYITSSLARVAATNVYNTGTVKLYGMRNVGYYSRGGYRSYNATTGLPNPGKIVLDSPIEMLGDKSIGIDLERPIDGLNSKINVELGGGVNMHSGNDTANNYDPLLVEETTGLYYNMVKGHASTITTLDDYRITADVYTKDNSLLRVETGELYMGDGNTSNNSGKNSEITSDGGNGNILVSALGKNSLLTMDTSALVTGINGVNQVGLYTADLSTATGGGATINFAGTLTVNGAGSKGAVADNTGTGAFIVNTGSINVSGGVYTDSANVKNGSVGVVVKGTNSKFTSNTAASSVTVDVDGNESTGLFSENGTIDISNGNIKTSDGAFNLYSKGSTANIKLTDTTLETGKKSLLFFSENGGEFTLNNVNATIKGGTSAADRGTAFYYNGGGSTINSVAISNYIKTILNNTQNQLTLNMESGARLFVLDDVSVDLSSATSAIGSLGINFTPSSTDYKTYMMYKSTLGIDQGVNLDLASDAYNNLEISTSSITNSGQTITGSNAGQAAIAQENGRDTSGVHLARNTITLTNDAGNINLSGASSIGMYASYGEIYNKNAGVINAAGDSSVGIYAVNGSKVDTTAGTEIKIGANGVGIFAEGYKQGVAQAFGDGKLDIKNTGKITANTGTGAVGIYLNNNSGAALTDSNLDLSTGIVDVSNSEGGVGVYVSKGTVKDSGSTITVGKNGVGLYAKDSDVKLTGTTINLYGDNALGMYLDGTTSFLGSGTINISGQNVVLFNLASSGSISNSFNVASITPGSSYTIGNIVGGAFEYTNTANLASDGTLVTGKNAAVYLNGSVITAAAGATNVAAMALDGQFALSLPAGMTAGTDGENNGTITLENNSAGLYGKNGARLSNKGTITVGNNSAGMITSGTNASAVNDSSIIIGEGSQGVYLKDGTIIENNGSILSSSRYTVAMLADNVTSPIVNSGAISLLGDKSVGIYTTGSSVKTINNTGTITIGDSLNSSDPGIGIYAVNTGDVINNSGTITSGKNSIGIYTENSTINQNGTVNTDKGGIGIYAKAANITTSAGSNTNITSDAAVGIYATNGSTITNNTANTGVAAGSYGFVLETGSALNNNGKVTLNGNSTAVYSDGANTVNNSTGSDITMSGNNNIAFYFVNGGTIVNDADIYGDTGKSNIGMYVKDGSITSTGTIKVGDSVLAYKSDGTVDHDNSSYSVGIYGDGSQINTTASTSITMGENAIGLYTKNSPGIVHYNGIITSAGTGSMGIFADSGTVQNNGTIIMSGDNSTGMVANKDAAIINNGTIKMSGKGVTAMFANSYSTIVNNAGSTIDMTGSTDGTDSEGNTVKSTAFLLGQGSKLVNNGTIVASGAGISLGTNAIMESVVGKTYRIPSLINAGIIETTGTLALDGISVGIKVDPSTVTYQANPATGPQFVAKGTSIIADTVTADKAIKILPGFSDGTISNVYKLEGIIQASSGKLEFVSSSLLWEATPEVTSTGVDIYMERKSFTDFTDGLWYEEFGQALERNFSNASGNEDATKIYNKTAYFENEKDFRNVMSSLAGDVYANINQREEDMARVFENSLSLLQNSTNNTKENVKINVITGKGKHSDDTDGVIGYDYESAGVLALREIERTYKHTFGYSVGYLHTGFEFKDGNESEEWVDTIQLGVHNKYKTDGWQLRNDITGRASIHNIDRNIDWPSPNTRSKINGSYETYSITSDNILGKEFMVGKQATVTPYGAFRAMYVTRPDFEEKGLEKLEVEENDAWSAKPRAGIEVKGSLPLGENSGWQLKGSLDVAYEYELADLNAREYAKLASVEDTYHKLAKPEDEKGTFRTRASVGVEIEDRYGIFVTGDYSTGNGNQDDYRVGVTLKAVF